MIAGLLNAGNYDSYLGNYGIENVDPRAHDNGYYLSIDVDRTGSPKIAYYDATEGSLKYAEKAGSAMPSGMAGAELQGAWLIRTVDKSKTGKFCSLKLDRNGFPNISYYDSINRALKFARFDGSKWKLTLVDSGNVGTYSSLGLDKNGNPHVAYYDAKQGLLKYAVYDGAKWDISEVDYARSGNSGKFASLALGSDDRPYVSYYDESNGCLKFASCKGGDWAVETVDKMKESRTGQFTSIAVGPSESIHISYYDPGRAVLCYAVKKAFNWELKTIDDETGTGMYSHIAVDSKGTPRIIYFSSIKKTVNMAALVGLNWSRVVLDSGGVGAYCTFCLDQHDGWHAAYRDITNSSPKYATSNSTPSSEQWPFQRIMHCVR